MSDLNVVAVLTAKAGSEGAMQEALAGLVEPTRAEAGCISYELFHSAADASTFVTVEKWKSQADLDAHMKTPHIRSALASAADAFAGPPAIHPLTPVGD